MITMANSALTTLRLTALCAMTYVVLRHRPNQLDTGDRGASQLTVGLENEDAIFLNSCAVVPVVTFPHESHEFLNHVHPLCRESCRSGCVEKSG